MKKLSDELAFEALRTLSVKDGVAHITIGDIGNSFVPLKSFLAAMGGRWNAKKDGFVFNRDFEVHLKTAMQTGVFNPKKANDFFATSPKMADEVTSCVSLLQERNGPFDGCYLDFKIRTDPQFVVRVLEPSAGHGALLDSFVEKFNEKYPQGKLVIDCCEIDPVNCDVLREKGYNVIHEGDFLDYRPSEESLYHLILMNPPFSLDKKKDCYIDHVEHAMNFCSTTASPNGCPGEILAIVPRNLEGENPSPKKARFLNRLNLNSVEQIKDGLFDDQRAFAGVGANVKTTLLKIEHTSSLSTSLDKDSLQRRVNLFGLHCSSGFGLEKTFSLSRRNQDVESFSDSELARMFEADAIWYFDKSLQESTYVDYSNLRLFTSRLALELGYERLLESGAPYAELSPETAFEKKLRERFFQDYEYVDNGFRRIQPDCAKAENSTAKALIKDIESSPLSLDRQLDLF